MGVFVITIWYGMSTGSYVIICFRRRIVIVIGINYKWLYIWARGEILFVFSSRQNMAECGNKWKLIGAVYELAQRQNKLDKLIQHLTQQKSTSISQCYTRGHGPFNCGHRDCPFEVNFFIVNYGHRKRYF